MELINLLFGIDLAKLHYSNVLIYTVVIVGSIFMLASFTAFCYFFFFKKVGNGQYQSNKKISIIMALSFCVLLFGNVSIFRVAYVWNSLFFLIE